MTQLPNQIRIAAEDAAENELEQLPVYEQSECKDCGSTEWASCNLHPDGGFHQCNNCHVFDEKQNKLIRRDLQ